MTATTLLRYGISFLVTVLLTVTPALAEDSPENLADPTTATAVSGAPIAPGVSKAELDANVSQLKSEVRSQRDLTELRVGILENEIQQSASYVERLLFAFMISGGIVVFVVLITLNKQTGINNEKMRNLIRESEHALNDLHRMLDRPEAEHFHVSRKLTRIMNKMRETEHAALAQKDIGDIYTASEDPTLPVTLHLQANALKQEQAGDNREAIILWERLLGIDNNNPEILLHLAKNYKKLAETSNGPIVNQYRTSSLDYFQQYATRTNQHLSAAHEQQRLRGTAAAQLPAALVAEKPHETWQPTPPNQKPQPAPPPQSFAVNQTPNTASKLLGESFVTAKPMISRKPIQPKAEMEAASNGNVEATPPAPASTSTPAADQSPPSVTPTQFSEANGKQKEEETKVASVKTAPVKPAKKASVKKAKPIAPVMNKVKTAVGNGKTKTSKKEELSDLDKEKAFNSRIDKSKDYFVRYGEARSADKLRWLESAAGELEIAETYQRNVKLYRLWGITWLEIARMDKGDRQEQITTALKLFDKGDKLKPGELSNEIALCHATLEAEDDCRMALEQARQHGTLNVALCREQPEFLIYQDRGWYQNLLDT